MRRGMSLLCLLCLCGCEKAALDDHLSSGLGLNDYSYLKIVYTPECTGQFPETSKYGVEYKKDSDRHEGRFWYDTDTSDWLAVDFREDGDIYVGGRAYVVFSRPEFGFVRWVNDRDLSDTIVPDYVRDTVLALNAHSVEVRKVVYADITFPDLVTEEIWHPTIGVVRFVCRSSVLNVECALTGRITARTLN